jgi:hypothetical protein
MKRVARRKNYFFGTESKAPMISPLAAHPATGDNSSGVEKRFAVASPNPLSKRGPDFHVDHLDPDDGPGR